MNQSKREFGELEEGLTKQPIKNKKLAEQASRPEQGLAGTRPGLANSQEAGL